jgi:predicted kinase
MKNILGYEVERPTQELVFLIGLPGSGKSTKAKTIVGDGAIHSTDDVISSMFDYSQFFKDMAEKNNFDSLHMMHMLNLQNAIISMHKGITPIIIDNTNLSRRDMKPYIEVALELGFDDNKIKFINIGTNGLTIDELFERNVHNVPLDKIKSMLDKHKNMGAITLENIMKENSKPIAKKKVLYSGVIIDEQSRQRLFKLYDYIIKPKGWTDVAHHMTIKLGEPVDESEVGKRVNLSVFKVGLSDKAMAVQVNGYPSNNKIPYITLAINPDGGKPKDSNYIESWINIAPFTVTGIVTNVTN